MFALLALTLAPVALPDAGWVAFDQPAVAGTQRIGCDSDGHASLASSDNHWNIHDDAEGARTHSRFTVYLEFEQGRIVTARSYTPDCVVAGRDSARLVELDAAAGAKLLRGLLDTAHGDALEGNLLAALAHIDHVDAMHALADIAKDPGDDDRGQEALFWLALRRGEPGRQIVTAHVDEPWPLEHRSQAVMALALSENPQAQETVRGVARGAQPAELRAQAVMALGITQAPGALADLHSIFLVDDDPQVREQAVFALAQLDSNEAARVLVDIIRTPRFGEHRRTALFWLTNMSTESSQQEIDALVAELF